MDLWDLIISKKGFNWDNSDIRNIDFHSSMALPQEKMVVTGYIDFNAGESRKTLTIPHGLGFTPWIFPYFRNNTSGKEVMLPMYVFNGALDIGEGTYPMISAYSDNTNIVFKVDFDPSSYGYAYNVFYRFATDLWSTWYDSAEAFTVGRYGSSGKDGAIRFENIPLLGSDTLTQAKLNIYTANKIGAEPKYVRFLTYGIDEDNTPSFNNPMGRSKTDAYVINQRTVPVNIGDTVEVDVLNQINEIKARGGWSKGNAMGFIINEQSSSDDAMIGDFQPYSNTHLRLTKSGTIRLYFKAVVLTEKIV